MSFANTKVSTKLYLGFSVPVVLLLVIIAVGITNLATMDDCLDRIMTVNNVRVNLTNDMASLVRENSISLRNVLLAKDIKGKQAEQNDIESSRGKYDEMFKKLTDLTPKEDTKAWELIEKIKISQGVAKDLNNQVIELSLAGKDSEAVDLTNAKTRPAVRKWIDAIDEANKYQDDRNLFRYEQAKKAYNHSRLLVFSMGAIAVFLAGLIAFLITRSIVGPLKKVIAGLSQGAEQVASASSQVSSSSQSLAEGASEQAASIEETSSSLEEISSMTKQNADHSNQANSLTIEGRRVVDQANGSMKGLTASMGEISKASEETSKIIKTIDEIAFQTNLLALNAAVEAARAGEAGAGFAVVAGEVRNLAMRAADAAKNTAGLIEGTVKKVKEGSELVARTNEAFSEVSKSVTKVGELVGEIAAASTEQSQGIDQVNKAIAEMDKVVQQNAANAEESASASEEMNAQAEQMKEIVEDLVVLVAGAGGDRGAHVAPGEHKVKALAHHVAPSLKGPKSSSAARGEALVSRKGKPPALQHGKEVSPKDVIPMQSDDFKDF